MRSRATILSSIWEDKDFLALSTEAKLMYVFLISQPKLSLVGQLDYLPARWTKTAGMSTERIEEAILELEESPSRFVMVDRDETELVVRTIVRHDPPHTWQAVKGMWSAWEMVGSKWMKAELVAEMLKNTTEKREYAWTRENAEVPELALRIRAKIEATGRSCVEVPEPDYEASRDASTQASTESSLVDATQDAREDPRLGRVFDPRPLTHDPLLRAVPATNGSTLTKPPRRSARAPDPEQDLGFLAFYAAYPLKRGKAEAAKAYRSEVTKGDPSDSTVIDALTAWVPVWQQKPDYPEFVPYPATWLRRHSWEDELPATKRPHQEHL